VDNITESRYKDHRPSSVLKGTFTREWNRLYSIVHICFSEDYKKCQYEEVVEASVDERQAYLILKSRK